MSKKVKLNAYLDVAKTITADWDAHCTFYAGPSQNGGNVSVIGSVFVAGPSGASFYDEVFRVEKDEISAFTTVFYIGPSYVKAFSGSAFTVGPSLVNLCNEAIEVTPSTVKMFSGSVLSASDE